MVVFIWLHRIPYLWSTPLRRDIGDAGWARRSRAFVTNRSLPWPVRRVLGKLGADIRDARRHHRIPTATMAERALIIIVRNGAEVARLLPAGRPDWRRCMTTTPRLLVADDEAFRPLDDWDPHAAFEEVRRADPAP